MEKIEHIGIAVKSLRDAIPVFEQLLGGKCYKTEEVSSEMVRTAFLAAGPNKIELLEPTHPDSVIAKYIDRKGEGLHHVAFAVADIEAEMSRLTNEGFTLLNAAPKKGADGKLVCFVHPRQTSGMLTELCMDDPNA